MTSIQPCLQFPTVCGSIRVVKHRFKFSAALSRKRIAQLECDELNDSWCIEVRQITTLMPATKTLFQLLARRFPGPLALGPDKFEKLQVPRRTAAYPVWIFRSERNCHTRPVPSRTPALAADLKSSLPISLAKQPEGRAPLRSAALTPLHLPHSRKRWTLADPLCIRTVKRPEGRAPSPRAALPRRLPHEKMIFVVVALSSQPRVGSGVTELMSLMEICRPRVFGLFTSISFGSHVCWLIFWCGAGL